MPSVLLTVSLLVFAGNEEFPSEAIRRFQELETINSMIVKTDVNEPYRSKPGVIFKLTYVDIPESEIHTIKATQVSPEILNQVIIINKKQERFIRFFIHPESVSFYKPLIDKYAQGIDLGKVQYYLASPTSSTRSVIAWNPKNPKESTLIVKTSLAKTQDDIFRLVPDREIRRSVKITEMLQKTPKEEWLKNGNFIIPEPFGAYISSFWNLTAKLDDEFGSATKHGYIIRDASFLNVFPENVEVYPFFALFTERETGPPLDGRRAAPPLIVEWFHASGEKDFHEYVKKTIIAPFVEKTGYLFFEHGAIPVIHSQNILVAIDRNSKTIKTVIHRDLGSFKIDMLLRLAKGKSVSGLMRGQERFDFNFKKSAFTYEEHMVDYFFDMTFKMDPTLGYGRALKKALPSYDSRKILTAIKAEFWKSLRQRLPIASNSHFVHTKDYIRQWLKENAPDVKLANSVEISLRTPQLRAWLAKEDQAKRFITVPASWEKSFMPKQGRAFLTDYGVVVRSDDSGGNAVMRIYYYDSEVTYNSLLQKLEPGKADCRSFLKARSTQVQ